MKLYNCELFFGLDSSFCNETLSWKQFQPFKLVLTWHDSFCICCVTVLSPKSGGGRRGVGGYFLIRGQWGCAAVWGPILTTGLTIMGSHIFEVLGVRQSSISYLWLANVPECLYCRWKVKCSSFNLKNGSIHKNRKRLSWDRENYTFATQVAHLHKYRNPPPSPFGFERLILCFTQFGGVFHFLNLINFVTQDL